MRFIHSSDWQLGMTRAFFDGEAAARFSQARIDAVTRLGALAAEHDAAFIVVAGDVFESNQLSQKTLARTLEALRSLPVPVFLLPGNHDPLDAASIYNTREFKDPPANVIVHRDLTPVPVPGLDAAEVVGAPWKNKRPTTDLCAELAASLGPASGRTRIAVCHGQVDTLAPDKDRPEIIDLAAAEHAIETDRFHYLALGDRHSVTEAGGTGRIWYSGAPLATAFDETDPNTALLVDIEGARHCTVERLEVGDWHFVAHAEALNGAGDLGRFRSWLDALPAKERTAVKVGFTGSVNLTLAAKLDALLEERRPRFASLEERKRTSDLAVVPDTLDEDSVALAGYARAAWDDLLAAARAGDDTARDALRLVYRLCHRQAAD